MQIQLTLLPTVFGTATCSEPKRSSLAGGLMLTIYNSWSNHAVPFSAQPPAGWTGVTPPARLTFQC